MLFILAWTIIGVVAIYLLILMLAFIWEEKEFILIVFAIVVVVFAFVWACSYLAHHYENKSHATTTQAEHP
jgi:hypothetical protein